MISFDSETHTEDGAVFMKNYIWDFDGMLFDSYPHIAAAFVKTLAEFGKEADYDEAKALLEVTFAHAYGHYDVSEEEKEIFRKYEHDYAFEPQAVPFPNTVATLKTLHERGARQFIYTHRGIESLTHYLEKYDILKYFEMIVDSTKGFAAKPAPDAVEHIVRENSLDKAETVMIGDREIDVLSGKNAGVYGCLYSKTAKPTAADFLIDDISGVLEL